MALYRKIDLFTRPKGTPGAKGWSYACSTFQSPTCKAAVARYQPDNGSFEVKASFAKPLRARA